MKILFINTFYYPNIIGGAEISIKKLAEGLANLGHEVVILTTGIEQKSEIINKVKIRRIKVNNIYSPIQNKDVNKLKKIIYRGLDLCNVFNYLKLKREIESIKPDIININNIYGLSIIIYKVIKDLNIKSVLTLRDYYMLCPKVHMLKNNDDCNNPNIICKCYKSFNVEFLKHVNYFTAPSKFVINKFIDNKFFDESKGNVIYNAIDLDANKTNQVVEKKLKRNKKELNYLYLGGLEKHKGLDILLKAFNEINNDNMKLFIAGKGSMEAVVKRYEAIDNRIKYLGFLNEVKMEETLISSDILIAPSLWNEPFGRIIIDAYKYGLPVITSNKGGLDEIVDDYITGIKLTRVTEETIKEAINYFMENNFDDLIINCKNKVKYFGIDHQVKKFSELYDKILKE